MCPGRHMTLALTLQHKVSLLMGAIAKHSSTYPLLFYTQGIGCAVVICELTILKPDVVAHSYDPNNCSEGKDRRIDCNELCGLAIVTVRPGIQSQETGWANIGGKKVTMHGNQVESG
ncbi:uncharacterized protein RHO17_021024 isoform 1-T3 [Thomomys bottae]